jgi:hypothetical protein
VGSTGIWYTDDLGDDHPVWQHPVSMSDINNALMPMMDPNLQAHCGVGSVRQIGVDPTRDGNMVVGITAGCDWGYPAPGIVGSSTNGGRSWAWHSVPNCGFNYWGNRDYCDFTTLSIGAGGQIYLAETGELVGHPAMYLSTDNGASWTHTSDAGGNHMIASYTLQMTDSVGLMVNRIWTNEGANRLWQTQDGGNSWHSLDLPPQYDPLPTPQPTATGQPTPDSSPTPTPVPNPSRQDVPGAIGAHSLQGFIDRGGVEHVFVNTLASPQLLYESTDMGNSWQVGGTMPYFGEYSIWPMNSDYRLAAPAGSVGPGPNASVISAFNGTDWVDRTGNWFQIFGAFNGETEGWRGNVFPLAPAFSQVHKPIDPDAVSGDGSSPTDYNTPNSSQGPAAGTINPRTGNFVYSSTDLTVQGPANTLMFHRVYSGQHNAWKDITRLGPGWFDNYNVRLIFADPSRGQDPTYEGKTGYVIFQEENGSRQKFIDHGDGTYDPELGLLATLKQNGTGPNYTYTVALKKQLNYQFDSLGRLTQIDQVSKLGTAWKLITLTYDTSVTNGALLCVIDGSLTGGNVGANQPYIGYLYYTTGTSAGRIKEVFDFRRGNPGYCTDGDATAANPASPSITFNND